MDPEVNDKTNDCETEETTMDSSPVGSDNIKEGAKKVLNEEECSMEVDKEDEPLPNNKNSETENGVSEKNIDNNGAEKDSETVKNDCQVSSEKVTPNNHEQNEDEKNTPTENSTNKKSDSAIDCEPVENKNDEENVQNSDKKENESSELVSDKDLDNQTDSSEKTTDINDASDTNSSKDKKSLEENSKDDVRPDKCSKATSEPTESSDAGNSSKKSSSNKETKDGSKSEVSTNEVKETPKESKDKSSEKAASTETKTESTKKDGETKKKKSKLCEECGKKGLKFQVLYKGKTRYLCSDACFKNFKSKQVPAKPSPEAAPTPAPAPAATETITEKCGQCQKELSQDQKYFPVVGETKALCSEECIKKYHTDNFPIKNCSQCKKAVENPQNPDLLTWETMVFCNEDCLGKYQSFLGSHCTCCQSPVPQASLGKYSVCFGADIRQFCSCSCLDDFKKNLKVCSFCQTDLSSGIDSFLAPVGDKGQFKDFCSQNCMERYEIMNNLSKNTPQTQVCSHCKKQGSFKIQVKHNDQTYALCGDLCVAGFRCAQKIKDKMCYTCFNFFNTSTDKDKDFSFKFDGQLRQFCTKACMTLFVLSHRKIVACISCKVKKYNFDMIEKQDSNNQTQIFCSLNCLSLYRVSVNAVSSKSVRCDNCSKTLPAQYHLTMSDGSVRNFCTYNCVLLFQNQYTNVCTLTTTSATRQTSASISTSTAKPAAATNTPVISNVCSLARVPGPTLIRNIVPPKLVARPPIQPLAVIGSKIYTLAPVTRVVTPVMTQTVPSMVDADQQMANSISEPAAATISSPSTLTTVTNASGQQVLREVIVKPPAPKSQKNKSVACKPIMQNKGINVKPQPCHKAVQTDDSPRPILLPVPVPYYVPVPVHMFSRPVPCPVPFPVPMFVPIVLPPKESSSQEKTPSSEDNSSLKVAEENNINDVSKESNSSQIEDEVNNKDDVESTNTSKSDEQNCEAPSEEHNEANDCDDDEEEEYVLKEGKNHHYGKRHRSHHKHKDHHKKSKTDDKAAEEVNSHNVATSDDICNSSVQNDHPEPAPILQYMRGVKAWKKWVIDKNRQIENDSCSKKFRLFKTNLLKLAPDELNLSLSLFVKEVKNNDGAPFSAGGLLCLCLGIQKYLIKKGRLDNIFYDPYYEKFTECLHLTLTSQERRYHQFGISVARCEEEMLWEAQQFGAYTPYTILHTVMYFNAKYFRLKTTDEHMKLSFNHLLTVFDGKDRKGPHSIGALRYYPKGRKCENENCNHNIPECPDGPKENLNERTYKEVVGVQDCPQLHKWPFRCPARMFDHYLSKCPESCRGRNDMFYLNPERSCVPDSTAWFTTQPLSRETLNIMIQRIKLIKEVAEN